MIRPVHNLFHICWCCGCLVLFNRHIYKMWIGKPCTYFLTKIERIQRKTDTVCMTEYKEGRIKKGNCKGRIKTNLKGGEA